MEQGGRRPPTDFNIRAGRLLRMKRTQAGMGQKETADAMGTVYQNISKYEYGINRLTLSIPVKFGELFGFDPVAFFKEVLEDDSPIEDGKSQLNNQAIHKVVSAMERIESTEDREIVIALAQRLAWGK